MNKEMNPEIFRNNLHMVIDELIKNKGIDKFDYSFMINPVVESDKPKTSIDEFMRLNVINPQFVMGKIFNFDEIVSMLTFYSPLVPIWINVRVIERNNKYMFELDISLRFRKPSLLRNQETGHAPFRAIL